MIIGNGLIYLDGKFWSGYALECNDNGKIKNIISDIDAKIDIDAAGGYIVPGLVDLHFHGCMGYDLCDGEVDSIREMAKYEASEGITSICPATMTFSEEILTPIMQSCADFKNLQNEDKADSDCANFVGINMEGPYISPDKVGAQNPQYVHSGDIAEFTRLQERAQNLIKLVDVAPEVEGNIDFIRETVASGVRVSLAHTCADYDKTQEAFVAGAKQMTHLFNAMNPIHHRNPGPIVAASENKDVMAELISDGIHSHPAIIRLAFQLFGRDRIILISDTMRACGLNDGTYDLGGQDVTVKGALATISGGAIAGSVTNLANCMRYAINVANIPLEDAIQAATENPAKALSMTEKIGNLRPGCNADVLVLNKDLSKNAIILRGKAI